MAVDELIIVNPFNSQHLEYIKQCELNNEITRKIHSYMKKIEKMTEQDYKLLRQNANEIEETLLLLKDNQIKDSCYLEGEKDRKVCSVTFSSMNGKQRNRKLLSYATSYAFDVLGMEDIFVKINNKDKNMIEILENQGFENLGEEKSDIIYLKENEQIKDNKGTYHENNR